MSSMRDLSLGDDATRDSTLRALRGAARGTVLFSLAHFLREDRNRALADSLVAILLEERRSIEDRRWGTRYNLVASAGTARWPQALRLWDRYAAAGEFDGWIVQARFAGHDTGGRAEAMLRLAEQTLRQSGPPDYQLPPNDPSLQVAQALVTRAVLAGDSAAVLDLRERLAVPDDDAPRPADPLPHFWRHSLAARLALLAGDTAHAIRELDTTIDRVAYPYIFSPLTSVAAERSLLATLLSATGHEHEAARYRRSFEYSEFLVDVLYLRPPLAELAASGQ